MQGNGQVPATPFLTKFPILISLFMTHRFGQLTLTAILLSGILTSCGTFGKGEKRQALLDHHLKLAALAEASEPENDHLVVNSKPKPSNTQSEVIMPLGDPQPMLDEIGLAPDGPSKPFAADPVDEVGLFPED